MIRPACILLAALCAAAPARAVELRCQPAPGAVMAYTLAASSETRSVGPGNRLDVTAGEVRIKGTATVAPSEEPDRVVLICRTTGGRQSIVIRQRAMRQAAPPATERVTMTTLGETVAWDLLEGDLPALEPPMRLMLEPADLCVFQGYGALPEGDVQPGDSWSGHYDDIAGSPDEESQRITYRSTLLGVGRFRGRPCARIATAYEVAPLETDPPAQGESVPIHTTMTGDAVWGFDIERGMILYYTETLTTSTRLVVPPESGLGASITSRARLVAQMTEYDGVPLAGYSRTRGAAQPRGG